MTRHRVLYVKNSDTLTSAKDFSRWTSFLPRVGSDPARTLPTGTWSPSWSLDERIPAHSISGRTCATPLKDIPWGVY